MLTIRERNVAQLTLAINTNTLAQSVRFVKCKHRVKCNQIEYMNWIEQIQAAAFAASDSDLVHFLTLIHFEWQKQMQTSQLP